MAGITWDEGNDVGGSDGPYRQTERLTFIRNIRITLGRRKAYYCFCTPEELEAERMPNWASKRAGILQS